MENPGLILYSTLGCHLCEEAARLLGDLRPDLLSHLRIIDVADDPAHMERYGFRIPVFATEHSGLELGWPFGHPELRQFLDSAHRAASRSTTETGKASDPVK